MATNPLATSTRACRTKYWPIAWTRSYSAPVEREIPAAKKRLVPTSGTYPKGFLAGSAYAGVKASNTKYDDVALVISEKPCPAAAVYTHNLFKAAPVQYSKEITSDERRARKVHGVVVNSGCANAVTGQEGKQNAVAMATAVQSCLSNNSTVPAGDTLVMSTGVIGQQLPIERIKTAIPKAHASLGSTHDHWMRAAQAICTTDTFPKLLSRTFTLPSDPKTVYSIAGMTKGAGMIHPNMGTLLGIVCTDARIGPASMHNILKNAANASFNRITIDGDTSTNDTVAFFANGAAAPPNVPAAQVGKRHHKRISEKREQKDEAPQADKNYSTFSNQDGAAFSAILGDFMLDLAKLVVRDGEGATKFVTVRVQSDASRDVSKAVAESIAKSSLVKTALYGKDANWGRILCAVGYTPGLIGNPERRPRNMPAVPYVATIGILPRRTSVMFVPADGSEPLTLLKHGEPQAVDEVRAKEILEMEDVEIFVSLNDDELPRDVASHQEGEQPGGRPQSKPVFEEVVYTCDLSHEYVTINGDYRT